MSSATTPAPPGCWTTPCAISEAGGYDDIGVLVYAQRGAMLIREGQLQEALAQLDHAVDFLEYAPPVDRAKVLLNRGELHGLLGDLAQAKDDCALALRLALESGPAELVFYATHNLGWYEFLAGNLPRALELMPTGEDALPDFERGIVGMDRAKALLSAGLVTEADRSLIDVCAAFSRTELVQFLAEAELIRAEVALLADQAELAHTLSHQAVARLKRRHNRRAIALGELVQLRADIARGTRRDRVLRKADRLVRTFTELGLRDQARMARLIAIEHAGPETARRRGSAADPTRTAARSPALQPSGPGEGGLRPRRYGSGPTTGHPGHGGDHRAPGPVRQSRPADLGRGVRREPGGGGGYRGDRAWPPDGRAGLAGTGPRHFRAGAGGAAAGGSDDRRPAQPAALGDQQPRAGPDPRR